MASFVAPSLMLAVYLAAALIDHTNAMTFVVDLDDHANAWKASFAYAPSADMIDAALEYQPSEDVRLGGTVDETCATMFLIGVMERVGALSRADVVHDSVYVRSDPVICRREYLNEPDVRPGTAVWYPVRTIDRSPFDTDDGVRAAYVECARDIRARLSTSPSPQNARAYIDTHVCDDGGANVKRAYVSCLDKFTPCFAESAPLWCRAFDRTLHNTLERLVPSGANHSVEVTPAWSDAVPRSDVFTWSDDFRFRLQFTRRAQ